MSGLFAGTPLVNIHIRTDRFHYVEKLWPTAARLLQEWQTGRE